MNRRLLVPLITLLLAITLAGCGGTTPLVDADQVPRAPMTGRVLDADTDQPIAGVQVFLAGTSYHATTDREGSFTIPNVPTGGYAIATRPPAYEGASKYVSHQPNTNDTVTLRLASNIDASAVSDAVVASLDSVSTENLPPAAVDAMESMERRIEQLQVRIFALQSPQADTSQGVIRGEDLTLFEQYFLGEDPQQCRLLNPDQLKLEPTEEAGTLLNATSRRPLEVVNRRLGYRMWVILNEFSIVQTGDDSRTVLSDAFVGFEPLPANSEEMTQRWQKARQNAYEGSFPQFLHALAAGEDAGFRLARSTNVQSGTQSVMYGGGANQSTSWVPIPDLQNHVSVTQRSYVRRLDVEAAVYQVRHGSPPTTWRIVLPDGSPQFTILGQTLAAGGIQTRRYWDVRPLCRQLPTHYLPPE